MRTSTGMPVHEVALFLNRYRKRGMAANTVHSAACSLALLYNHLERHGVDLLDRLRSGQTLTSAELDQLTDLAQYRVDDPGEQVKKRPRASDVRSLEQLRLPHRAHKQRAQVDVHHTQTRIRHFLAFLGWIGEDFARRLQGTARVDLQREVDRAVEYLKESVPRAAVRSSLRARRGLTKHQEDLLLATVDPESPTNPWRNPFVRERNYLIVRVLLAVGLRRGELAAMQVGDLGASAPTLTIYRRADDPHDARKLQPVAKTRDRRVDLSVELVQRLKAYLNLRRTRRAARRLAQFWVTDDGNTALSYDAFGKIFDDIRRACPELPRDLTAHIPRHTWNDRFRETAKAEGIPDALAEKAQIEHQGWEPGSAMPSRYTQRHVETTANQVSLKLQSKLESKVHERNRK